MKIYVGTLYCGENEFDRCMKSIKNQNYSNYEQFIYEGLNQKEAHDSLYGDFVKSGFDLLVHVGPDMILRNDNLFRQVVAFFVNNPQIQHYEIMVYDCPARRMIWGLNFYHNIDWHPTKENVFTDFLSVGPGRKVSDFGNLAPAAWHCPDPGLFQSFRYGAHKSVKLMESIRRGWTEKAEYYREIISDVFNAYKKYKDDRRGLCLVGARFAVEKKISAGQLNYTDPYLKNEFDKLLRKS